MRYTVQIDLYIEAKNDTEAVEIAEKIAFKQRKKYDNQCKLLELWKTPFASLFTKKLDIDKIKFTDNEI